MTDLSERMIALINNLQLSPTVFAESVSVSPAAILRILRGKNKPGFALMTKIVAKHFVCANWLLTGHGEMFKTNNNNEWKKPPVLTTEINYMINALKLKFLTAKRHFVFEGANQKEAAAKAGVSEKTIGKWIKAYNWKAERDDYTKKQFAVGNTPVNGLTLIEDLKSYLDENSPAIYAKIKPVIDNYIKLITNQ